jgi:hypothetical protein
MQHERTYACDGRRLAQKRTPRSPSAHDPLVRGSAVLAPARCGGPAAGAAAVGFAATASRLVRLARKRAMRRGATRLALQDSAHRSRAARRRAVLCLRLLCAFPWRERHARAPRLGEADRNGLLRALRAVLAATDMVHLFLHEFARRGARALTLPQVAPCACDGAFFRHEASFRRVFSARVSPGPALFACPPAASCRRG